MDRRAFIKLTAVTSTSATLASCGNPEHHLIRFIPDEDLAPGVAEWKPGVCPVCQAGCGLNVRVMQADADVVRGGQAGVVSIGAAKKLEGSAPHPVNRGGLCPRGQASIQITYHPDRLIQPLKRTGPRGSGQYQPVSWDDGLAEVVSHLDALAAAGNQKALAFLGRPGQSQRHVLIAEFLSRFGAGPAINFELFGDEVLRRANGISFGREQRPTFDLARARFVLAFGADFLGTWNSPVAQSVGYGEFRQGRRNQRGKFVQVEARMTQTGANADEWMPVKPGTEGVLALGIAHVIMRDKLRAVTGAGRAGAAVDGWSAGLTEYGPDAVAKITGAPAARIVRIAHEFAESAPAVAIVGGPPLAHSNALFHALAVNALNALVGSVDVPGGVSFMNAPQAAAPKVTSGTPGTPSLSHATQELSKLVAELNGGGQAPPTQVLLLDGVNPVFTTPRAWKTREALEKVPFIASFGSFLDETSELADVILPDHSFLESWIDAIPESGATVPVVSVAGPAMKPLHQTRAMPDVLLDIGRRLKKPLAQPLVWKTFDEMLKAAYGGLPAMSQPSAAGAAPDVWADIQRRGGWWGEPSGDAKARTGAAADTKPAAAAVRYAAPQFDGAENEFPFHFLPYASAMFLDGSTAHLPWLQEMPDPLTSAMWSSWVEINPKTAERLKLEWGAIVEVASRHGSLRAPVVLSPGLAPDIVAMPAGQGHRNYTRYATGRGANPVEILAPVAEAETGALAWAATRVRVSRVSGPDGSLTAFAGSLKEEPHGHER